MQNILAELQGHVEDIAAIPFETYALRSTPSYAIVPVVERHTSLHRMSGT